MDQLSPSEKAQVEEYLISFPQLKEDIREIEASLEVVARGASRSAPAGLKDKILEEIRNDQVRKNNGPSTNGMQSLVTKTVIALLLTLGILLTAFFYWQKSKQVARLEQILIAQRDSCQQNQQQLNAQLQLLQQLTFPDNKILPFQATPGFASTDLYLHHNAASKRNFIQVRELPAIADNQSYQLWSLKPDQAPIPLDVFEMPENGLLEVRYEEGTQTYAITIEPKGGRNTPTLENLIGTVSVAGI
jgi:hypothetical protein